MSHQPINLSDHKQVVQFCHAVWSWDVCEGCQNQKGCVDYQCPGSTFSRLQPFLQHCKRITSPETSLGSINSQILPSKEDLFSLIGTLRARASTITRKALRENIYGTSRGDAPIQTGQDAAINIAIKVLVMTDCSPIDHWSDRLETGTLRRPWKEDVTFNKFIEDMLPPRQTHRALSYPESPEYADFKSGIKATKLVKHLGISFRSTDDIRDHLYFDRKRRELRIFSFTGFLKEQLRLTKDSPKGLTVADALKLSVLVLAWEAMLICLYVRKLT